MIKSLFLVEKQIYKAAISILQQRYDDVIRPPLKRKYPRQRWWDYIAFFSNKVNEKVRQKTFIPFENLGQNPFI